MGRLARFRSFVRRRPVLSGVGAAAIVGIGAYLFFGFFAFHLLFVDSTVDEANPFADAAVATTTTAASTTTASIASNTPATTAAPATTTTTEPVAPSVQVVAQGQFISLDHPTVGTASIITDGQQQFLRFEGFETDNGPDLNVYLGTGTPQSDPGEFIDLGDLKGNIGDQNYELQTDIDLSRYTTVYIWCVRFNVGFGSAPLS